MPNPFGDDPINEEGAASTPELSPFGDKPETFIGPARDEDAFNPRFTGSVFEPKSQKIKRKASQYYRPALETAGSIIGATVATPADVATLSPGPTILGGALGYAGGKRVADYLDAALGIDEPDDLLTEMKEAVKDVAVGATYEMGGQSILPAYRAVKGKSGWIWEKLSPKAAAKKQVGEVVEGFMAPTTFGDIYASNIDEAKQLEKDIPGLKFTLGQRTNMPKAIQTERAAVRGTDEGANLFKELESANNTAIRNYYGAKFTGKEGIDELLTAAETFKSSLGKNVDEASELVDNAIVKIARSDPEGAGSDIFDALRENVRAHKQRASELYDAVPDFDLDTEPLTKAIKEIEEAHDPDITKATKFPTKLVKGIKKKLYGEGGSDILGPGGEPVVAEDLGARKLKFSDLREIRSEIMDEARNPNISPKLRTRLSRLQEGVEESIDQMEQLGVEEYRKASSFYRQFQETFSQGAVGDVLARGPRGELTRFGHMDIAKKFFNPNQPGNVDALTKALGQVDDGVKGVVNPEIAKKAIKEFAVYDFVQKTSDALTGDISSKKAANWLKKNKMVLDRYGIGDEFKDVARLQRTADASMDKFKQFEKSAAAKLLDADPEKAIEKAFSGQGAVNTKKAVRELLNTTNTPESKAGLKNAFADFMINKAQRTAKDISNELLINSDDLQKVMKRYEPAMNELYKDDLSSLSAMKRVQKAVEIQLRNTKSPLGDVPATTESVATVISKMPYTAYWPVNFARNTIGYLGRSYKGAVNKYMLKAMFDPDEAKFLTEMMRKQSREDPEKALRMFKDRLMVSGLINLGRDEEEQGMQDRVMEMDIKGP